MLITTTYTSQWTRNYYGTVICDMTDQSDFVVTFDTASDGTCYNVHMIDVILLNDINQYLDS